MENTYILSYSDMYDNPEASVFDELGKSMCHYLSWDSKIYFLTYWTIKGLLAIIQFEKSNQTLSKELPIWDWDQDRLRVGTGYCFLSTLRLFLLPITLLNEQILFSFWFMKHFCK